MKRSSKKVRKKKRNMENLKLRNKVLLGALALVAVFGIGKFVYAQYEKAQVVLNVAGNYNDYRVQPTQDVSPQPSFSGVSGSYLGDIEQGPSLTRTLDFGAGSTTTPGGLFSILNDRRRICSSVSLDIDTADTTNGRLGTGHPMVFSVATSTSGSALTGNLGLIASTTQATGTARMIDSIRDVGSYVGADQDVGGEPWVWGKGVYLLGQFDSLSTDPATSSDVYTGQKGRVSVDCVLAE